MYRYGIILLFIFCSTIIHAAEEVDLFTAKAVAQSKSTTDRNKALRAAFESVLIKVAGKSDVLDAKPLKTAMRNYRNYVANYRYQTIAQQLHIVASFNEQKVSQLFIANNIPIWSKVRPQILVWLIVESGLKRELVSASSHAKYVQAVENITQKRGIPFVLPIMDLEDLEAISGFDVWGRFDEQLSRASQRYLADAYVVVRVSDNSLIEVTEDELEVCALCQKPLVVDWSLTDETRQDSPLLEGTSDVALITEAFEQVADEIHARYASVTSESNELLIEVANIDSLASFVDLTNFLNAFTTVSAVELVKVDGSVKTFKLSLVGSNVTFLSSLKLNRSLQHVYDPLAPPRPDDIPVFLWSKS